jgi:uncharacterized delta-60 repeat protein
VLRLLPDGTPDPSFGDQGQVAVDINFGSDDYAVAVSLDSDGGYLVAGYTVSGDESQIALVRLLATGDLDENFGNGGIMMAPPIGAKDTANLLYTDSDGKMLVLGLTTADGNTFDLIGARFLPTGDLDTSFGQKGTSKVPLGWMYATLFGVSAQSDGRLVISGRDYTSNYYTMLVGLNPDGTPDSKFGTAGVVSTGFGANYFQSGSVSTVQSDGTIMVLSGGPTYYYSTSFSRYLPTGVLDSKFGQNGSTNASVGAHGFYEPCAIVANSDGTFLALNWTLGGTQGGYIAQVVKLNSDGTVDNK